MTTQISSRRYHYTCVAKHKENGPTWEGNGAKFANTLGLPIPMDEYMAGASHLNIIRMAMLHAKDEDLFDTWQDSFALSRRNDVHASVGSELGTLSKLAKD